MCIFRLQCLAADAMAAGPVLAECWCTAIADPRSAARYAAVASYTTQSVVSEKYARRVDQPLFALPGLVVLQQWAPREKNSIGTIIPEEVARRVIHRCTSEA